MKGVVPIRKELSLWNELPKVIAGGKPVCLRAAAQGIRYMTPMTGGCAGLGGLTASEAGSAGVRSPPNLRTSTADAAAAKAATTNILRAAATAAAVQQADEYVCGSVKAESVTISIKGEEDKASKDKDSKSSRKDSNVGDGPPKKLVGMDAAMKAAALWWWVSAMAPAG